MCIQMFSLNATYPVCVQLIDTHWLVFMYNQHVNELIPSVYALYTIHRLIVHITVCVCVNMINIPLSSRRTTTEHACHDG